MGTDFAGYRGISRDNGARIDAASVNRLTSGVNLAASITNFIVSMNQGAVFGI